MARSKALTKRQRRLRRGPPGAQGIQLLDLPREVLCLIADHVASDTDYARLVLTCWTFRAALSDPLTSAAWLAMRKGQQQALRLAALGLRRQDVFCRLLEFFQVPDASVLQPQQYAQQQQQAQQHLVSEREAMDTSPLHLACEAGFVDAVRRLLPQEELGTSRQANQIKWLKARNSQGCAPLHLACMHGHAKIAEELLMYEPKDMFKSSNPLSTVGLSINGGYLSSGPLHLACRYNHPDIVTLLDRHEVPLSAEDENGHSPIDIACLCGSHEALCALLAQHRWLAKPTESVCRPKEMSVLMRACTTDHADIVSTLLDAHTDILDVHAALLIASSKGHAAAVRALLGHCRTRGAAAELMVMRERGEGRTALHEACRHGQVAAVQELLATPGALPPDDASLSTCASFAMGARGALNALAWNGETPLHLACWHGHACVVELLLPAVAKLDERASSSRPGRTWAEAVFAEDLGGVHLPDAQGCTALARACLNGHMSTLDVLLRHEQPRRQLLRACDAPPYAGLNVLHLSLACARGDIVARLLAEPCFQAAVWEDASYLRRLLQPMAGCTAQQCQHLQKLMEVMMTAAPGAQTSPSPAAALAANAVRAWLGGLSAHMGMDAQQKVQVLKRWMKINTRKRTVLCLRQTVQGCV